MLGSNRNREERTDDSEAKPGESMITVTAGSKRPGTTSELFEEKGKIHLILCRHKSDEIYFLLLCSINPFSELQKNKLICEA